MKNTPSLKGTFLSLILCFNSIISLAQHSKDTLVAYKHFKKADSLLTSHNYKESITFFSKALPIYKKEKAWERVAHCYNKLSHTYWYQRKQEPSLKNAEKAVSICSKYLNENSAQEAYAKHNKGNYYLKRQDYPTALAYYKKSLAIRQKALGEDNLDTAVSYNDIGVAYYFMAQYQTSLEYFKKALGIRIKNIDHKPMIVAASYTNVGILYDELGKLDIGISYLKKSLDIGLKKHGDFHWRNSIHYLNLGESYFYLKQYDEALNCYLSGLKCCEKKENLNHIGGELFLKIGNLFLEKGEFDKSLQYFKKSLNTNIEHYGAEHSKTAECYAGIASAYQKKGDITKAKKNSLNALKIFIKIHGKQHNSVASIYTDIGGYFVEKKAYDSGLEYYVKALDIFKEIYKDGYHYEVIKLHQKIGDLYTKKGIYNEGLNYFQKALTVVKKASGDMRFRKAAIFKNIGNLYLQKKEYTLAIEYFNESLLFNTKNNEKSFPNELIGFNQYFDLKLLLDALHLKAKTLELQFLESHNPALLDQSRALYTNADLLIDYLRQSHQNYEDKITLAGKAKTIYTDAIKAQLLVFKKSKQEKALAQAWYFSEKSKANTLKELLEDSNTKDFTGIPDNLVAIEKKIKLNKAYYQSQITKEQTNDSINTKKIKSFENELFSINLREDSLSQVLKKEHPKYHQLKHSEKLTTIKEIQAAINNQTTVLEFFVTDSINYAFTISKNNFSVKALTTKKLNKKIEFLNTTITSENSSDYQKKAYQLYQELVLPVKENIVGNELIIIPDGPLWHLNFDLLLTQKTDNQNSRNWPYLLKDYAVSYGSSAHLIFNTTKSNSKEKEQLEECLAFSFSNTESAAGTNSISLAAFRDTGDDLPGTREEIKSISKIFDGQYYYGSQANEANFKVNSERYKIIHLALHGEVDDQDPQKSKLYFNKSKNTIEDNLLYAHELFALNVPAELTVLSACNTGSGKIVNGEGIMSLGNAFQYAGTKSLLLSNWEVSDKTTPMLMKYFYTNLKDGMNKAKALQQAKLKYLTTTEAFYTHPFYWGSFYVLGDSSPISSNNYLINIYLWGIITLFSLLISIYFIKKS